MTDGQRGQLVSLWLLAADHDGKIPDDPMTLQKLCFMSKKPDLELFISLGFIDKRRQGGVKVATLGSQRDAPEEIRLEAETDKTLTQFEKFWEVYPRKVGKIDAEKVWSKLDPGNGLVNKILKSVGDHCETHDWIKDGGEYIPYPAKFLRQGYWENEINKNQEGPKFR